MIDGGMSAGANLMSGALNYFGQRETNKSNRRMAREQMDFQERMSSTAYQRARADMELAGINPIMAYSQGGASSPSGASATMQNPLSDNGIGQAVSSAQDARRLKQELENLRLIGTKTKADTAYTKALTNVAHEDERVKAASAHAMNLDNVGKEVEAKIDDSVMGPVYRIMERLNPLRMFK